MKYSLDVHYLHCSIHNSWDEVGKDVAIVFSYISLSSLKWLKKEIKNILFPRKPWILSVLHCMNFDSDDTAIMHVILRVAPCHNTNIIM